MQSNQWVLRVNESHRQINQTETNCNWPDDLKKLRNNFVARVQQEQTADRARDGAAEVAANRDARYYESDHDVQHESRADARLQWVDSIMSKTDDCCCHKTEYGTRCAACYCIGADYQRTD